MLPVMRTATTLSTRTKSAMISIFTQKSTAATLNACDSVTALYTRAPCGAPSSASAAAVSASFDGGRPQRCAAAYFAGAVRGALESTRVHLGHALVASSKGTLGVPLGMLWHAALHALGCSVMLCDALGWSAGHIACQTHGGVTPELLGVKVDLLAERGVFEDELEVVDEEERRRGHRGRLKQNASQQKHHGIRAVRGRRWRGAQRGHGGVGGLRRGPDDVRERDDH
mmetsp:Transcript_3482/g.12232  ORF Transcript_3482/g.12232 Transcript_3482/m.12232 type:complete len:227 (+) Transcript_3482:912-1592(+)